MGGDEAVAGILKTKLYSPRLPDIIPREELLKQLGAARKAKLTTIVAGAGYGKSTLAAAFLADQKVPSVWYQLEETDRDLSEFITYLVAGIGMKIEGFGEKILDRLQAAESISGLGEAIVSTFISEIDSYIQDDFFLALDDFQKVNDSPQVTGALDFLLSHIPPSLHLIILSRVKPKLNLATLAAYRELIDITEDNLRFSLKETTDLFNEIFGLPLEDDEARTLHDFTEGWITGLVLFWLAVKDKDRESIGEALLDPSVPAARFTEYLSGVVFESLSEQVKEFIMKTSVLARMNPEFCDNLLETSESTAILDYLANSRLFTIPLDDRGDWYRYHHLLQSFLKGRLSENLSQEKIEQLNLRAAVLWEKQGEHEQVLFHYLEAGEFDKAADVLEEMALGLMNTSRISFLYDNLSRLPEEKREKHPWLAFDFAKISDILCDYEAALKGYKTAAALFEQKGDIENQARSMINRGWLLRRTGRPDEASDYLSKGIEILPADSRIRRKVAAIMSSEYAIRGLLDESIQYQSEALEGIDGLKDEERRATLLSWCGLATFDRGDITNAYELHSRACDIAERNGLEALLPYIYPVLCFSTLFKGHFHEALEYAKKGLYMSEKLGITPMVLVSRFGKAHTLSLMGKREEALKDIEKALELSRICGPSLEVAETESTSGGVFMICGDHAESIKHLKKGVWISEQGGYRSWELISRLLVVWQSAGDLDIDEAREEIKTVAEAYIGPGSGFLDFSHDLVLALLEVMAGREEEARRYLETAIELTSCDEGMGSWRMMWRGREAPRLLPLAAEFFSRGKHLEYLGHALSSIGAESSPYLRELEKSKDAKVRDKAKEVLQTIARETAEPLEIRMLGPFEVTRGGDRISVEDWRSKKALAVLKYLAAQDDRRLVPRDVLMELLWPESTPESAYKNLSVALSSLRKTLEPEADRGESSYLVVSGDALRLELGRGGCTDFKLFKKKIREAGEAKMLKDDDLYLEKLQEAEELYRGDFLSDDLYEDWCRTQRDELHGEYLNLLLDISDENLRTGNAYAALSCIVKATKADPGREDLCRRQMEVCAHMGDRAGVERAYQRLSGYLKEEFEVEPSPKTVELYRDLRGGLNNPHLNR